MYVIAMYFKEDVKMVKRYDPISKGEFTPVDDGPFVDYAECVALQAECERLRKDLRNRGVAQDKPDDGGWFAADPEFRPQFKYDIMWSDGDVWHGASQNDTDAAWNKYSTPFAGDYITHWRPSKASE